VRLQEYSGHHLRLPMVMRLFPFLILFLPAYALAQIPDSIVDPDIDRSPLSRIDTLAIPISTPATADVLDGEVISYSRDTAYLDASGKQLHLIGDASVRYQGSVLTADYIIVDLEKSIATAQGLPDSTGKMAGLPVFNKEDREFTAEKITFNFKTEKGKITDIRTREQDIYILGEDTKYVSAGSEGSVEEGDAVYIKNGEFTTCDHPEPHYALKSTKIKTVLDKVAVTGPANLQISRVPTPVWLPFGFFPLTSAETSGLIFPRDYEYSEELGFGLRNIGYYFPINDQMDLTLTTDIYFNGTFAARTNYRYKKRYKYNGGLNLSYRSQNQEVIISDSLANRRINSFGITWRHAQDAKAHPTRSFSGDVNFQTNNNARRTYNDARSVSNNIVRSNVNFTQRFPGKPYSFSASLNHSQNNNTGEVSVTFPQLDFRMQRIFPLKRKKRIGPEKWYEKTSFQYSANAKNRFLAQDSTLFTEQTLRDARFGFQHDANTQLNLKVLQYFTFTPSIDYEETYFSHTRLQTLSDELLIDITRDTLIDGSVVTTRDTTFGELTDIADPGLASYRDLRLRASLNTQLFGTLQFKKGWLRGIRHSIRPNVSFTYRPDQTTEQRDYERRVLTDLRPEFADTLVYNKFRLDNQLYNVNPVDKQMSLGYGVSNNIEAKYWSKKDSSFKKLKLINNLNFSGNYNFAADSLNFCNLSGSGSTTLLKGVSTITYRASWSYYALGEEGRPVDRLYYKTTGKPLRFAGATVGLRTSINARTLKALFKKDNKERGTAARQSNSRGSAPQQDDLLSLLQGLSLEHNYSVAWIAGQDSTTSEVRTNILSCRISRLQITPNWNLRVGNIGYNFLRDQLTFPDFGVYRDLHCWELGMDWQPFRGTFNFYIRVKPSSFSFLNLPYRRNNVDGPLNF